MNDQEILNEVDGLSDQKETDMNLSEYSRVEELNLNESIKFLNIECGYIDVENHDDYNNKEILKIANSKYRERIEE